MGTRVELARALAREFTAALGIFPLENQEARVPDRARAGFQTTTLEFPLGPPGCVPPEMVQIPGGTFQPLSLNPVHLDDSWMDTHEVTNKQFRDFIEKGGCIKPTVLAGEICHERPDTFLAGSDGGVSRRDWTLERPRQSPQGAGMCRDRGIYGNLEPKERLTR